MGIYDELASLEKPQATRPSRPLPSAEPPRAQTRRGSITTKAVKPTVSTSVTHDAMNDVVTSLLEGVDVSRWRELLAGTETHNASLRLSALERDEVEDLVRDLRRADHIRTSMNELARLGLLLLVHDFRRRGKKSVINRVKKS